MLFSKTRVEKRRFEDIGNWMLEGKQAELPEVLRGVFFMDGNTYPEDCMTFQGMAWNAEKRSVMVPLFAHLQWTWPDSSEGRRALSLAKFLRNTLEIKFEDGTLKKATITPIFFGFLRVPSWFRKLLLIRAEDDTSGDTWHRRTFSGEDQVFAYTLRRIITGEGEPTPAFEDMLSRLPDTCLVNVDKRRRD